MGGSSSRGRTHDRTALSSNKSSGRGRQGGGSGRGGWNCNSGCGRAWIGAVDRGRRRAVRPRTVVVSSAGLHHGWAREGEEVEKRISKHGNENLK